ncbi:MAG: hypothetical protein Q8O22_02335 [Candidatus Omnitrophota bacterium]|nr:hypothetical protein [Candidatus Omnitrophota bacterium]
MFRKKGQSTLEYVLILTAIIGAIILAASTFIGPRVQNSINHVTNQMQEQVERIQFGGAAAGGAVAAGGEAAGGAQGGGEAAGGE